jgi:ATP-dependent Clp protease adaptor protein ClpS
MVAKRRSDAHIGSGGLASAARREGRVSPNLVRQQSGNGPGCHLERLTGSNSGGSLLKRGWSIPGGGTYTDVMVQTVPTFISDGPLMPFADRPQAGAYAPRAMADDDNRSGGPEGPSTSVITKTKPKTKRPNLYRVLILNDDYTPMEFVVHVLEKFFQKDVEAATQIMLHVHHHGIGECGVFTYEIAETKVTQVMDFARKHQHPLQCVMEKK